MHNTPATNEENIPNVSYPHKKLYCLSTYCVNIIEERYFQDQSQIGPIFRCQECMKQRELEHLLELEEDRKEFPTDLSLLKEKPLHRSHKETANGPSWLWITVNPKPNVDPTTFTDEINDIVTQSKYVISDSLKYVYAFEQRLESRADVDAQKDSGLHCHILLQAPNEKRNRDNFVTGLRKRLTKFDMIGDSKHVYAKTIPHSLFQQKLRYITGHKKDPLKKMKIDVDGYYFEKLGIPNLIFNFNYKDEL